MAAAPRRALIIDADTQRIQELREALADLGVECQTASNATEGWRAFAKHRPSHVFAALSCDGAQCGDQFLRKLDSDFIGAMPPVFLTCSAEELAERPPSDTTAYVIWPIARAALQSIFAERPALGDTAGRQVARLRELYELTLLGPSLMRELDFVCTRAALGFQVSNCIVWGPASASHWPRSTESIAPEAWPALREQCELAMHAGTTVLMSDGAPDSVVHAGLGRSLLAAPLGPVGEEPLAGICMVSNDGRRFSAEERDSIRILATRLSSELAWMSAHNRLVDEHEKLRQTALLDPMLGVWTRPALQEAISHRISAERMHKTSLAIVLFDFTQLRTVNDRHGHIVGDAVLAHFAKVVGNSLRAQDQLGRFGGDELAALLVGPALEEARGIAQAILDILAATPYQADQTQIPIDVRAGVTLIDTDEDNSEAAFGRAQLALENAKRADLGLASVERSTESGELDLGPSQGDLLSAGSTLGGMYRILHEISRGSMGVVYRGEDLGLGRPIAIKVLRSDLSSDEELVMKFRSEAALLASLRHRNLVQVYSFGTESEHVYFVMELVEGEPLSQVVRHLAIEGKFIDLEAVSKIVEEIAEALDAIHSLGIVHRDVKPENVLVDRSNDRAVLVDVGIAKRQGDARDAAGTPGFAAPESFMEADETAATDVYGLAATTYAALTGSPPYEGDDLSIVVNQQLNEPPLPPTSVRSDLSKAVDSVLATALDPRPNKRYRSANAFAIALNRALSRRPEGHAATEPALPSSAPSASRVKRASTIPDRRISTYRVSPITGIQPAPGIGSTRGLVFRVLGTVLAHELGSQCLDSVSESSPLAGELLKPTLPPGSWHPTEHLLWLLHWVRTRADSPDLVIRALGESIASSTLARVFGADPASQSPRSLLKAAESYWSRYHSWGQLLVHSTGTTTALIEVANSPGDEVLCDMLAGMFGQIPTMAGAAQSECSIQSCKQRGAPHCTFEVTWSETTAVAPFAGT